MQATVTCRRRCSPPASPPKPRAAGARTAAAPRAPHRAQSETRIVSNPRVIEVQLGAAPMHEDSKK